MKQAAGRLQSERKYSRFARAQARNRRSPVLLAILLVNLAALFAGNALAQESLDDDTGAKAEVRSLDGDEAMQSAPAETPEAPGAAPESMTPENPTVVVPPPPMTVSTPSSSTSSTVQLEANAPLRYVVKKGDTLWDIADHFLKEPWKWPELWYGNPGIKNPHLIYPGDVLYLTYVDGKPRLSREPPSVSGVDKLSPRVREQPLEDAIPTIPGDAIRAFLRGPRVVGAEELDGSPYIVEFAEEHLIGGAGIPAYVKGLDDDDPLDHSIVRKGEIYRDPEDNEVLGYEAAYIGTARVMTPGEAARIQVTSSVREVLVGDRLLPQDEGDLLASAYYPHAPDSDIAGHIIAVNGGVSQIAQYQIVTLSKGERDGVETGHVFIIWQAGRQVRDPYGSSSKLVMLPEEKAGQLLVFKTYERVSYALVMKTTRSVHVLDKFRTPER